MDNSIFISPEQAVERLLKGDVVALPTETVYGLAAIATDINAVRKIFILKQRPFFNPLICHIHSPEILYEYSKIEEYHKALFSLWPGPLTILLKKKNIPDIVTAGSEYCAFRIPNHPIFLKVLEKIKIPLAAPSANPSGKISPINAQMVFEYFQDQISGIVDGGNCTVGLESTVIKFLDPETILILRTGVITKEILESLGYKVTFIDTVSHQKLESPGLLSKHYAPGIPLVLFDKLYLKIILYGGNIIESLKTYIPHFNLEKLKIGILFYGKNPEVSDNNLIFYNLSEEESFPEIAKNLFSFLKELEKKSDLIIAFKVNDDGIGKAINDRLKRASEYQIEAY